MRFDQDHVGNIMREADLKGGFGGVEKVRLRLEDERPTLKDALARVRLTAMAAQPLT
jgi:hypothetical protein